MTTPRIEQLVEVEKTIDEQIDEIIDALVADVHFEKTWPAHTAYYQIDLNQFQEKFRQALTEAYQAGIDEAVEIERNRFMRLIQEYSHTTEPEWIAKDLMEAISNEEV